MIKYMQISFAVPRSPTNVELTAIDPHSFLVSWSAPNMSDCTDVDEYIVDCNDYYYYDHYYAVVPSHSLNATIVHDLDITNNPYSIFECFVRGNNSAGQGSYGYGLGRKYIYISLIYINQ